MTNKAPVTTTYTSDSDTEYKITITWQAGDREVGIPEGYFFDVEGLDCDETDCSDTYDECLSDAEAFIENMEYDAADDEDEEDDE